MDGMKFSGRGFSAPALTTTIRDDGIAVRAECERNSEAWAELYVTGQQLGELFARFLAHQEEITKEEQQILDRLIKLVTY